MKEIKNRSQNLQEPTHQKARQEVLHSDTEDRNTDTDTHVVTRQRQAAGDTQEQVATITGGTGNENSYKIREETNKRSLRW